MLSPTIEVGEVAQFYSVGGFFCESAGGYPTPTPILRQQTATSALEELELEGPLDQGSPSAIPVRARCRRGSRRGAGVVRHRGEPWRGLARGREASRGWAARPGRGLCWGGVGGGVGGGGDER